MKQQYLGVQKGAVFLTAQAEPGHFIAVWAIVDTEAEVVNKSFVIYETGERINYKIDSFIKYISTARIGGSVFHVFEYLQ